MLRVSFDSGRSLGEACWLKSRDMINIFDLVFAYFKKPNELEELV